MKKVAILILNWNGVKLMRKFLPSIIKHSPQEIADVIVADNGSTDDSLAMLKEEFPSVGIIALDKNYGFAEGYNRAIAQVEHEFTILLNSDVEVSKGWLQKPMEVFAQHSEIAAIQPKILDYKRKEYFEYAGAAGGFMDIYGYPFCRGRIFNHIEKDEGQYETMTNLLWATGACLFVRTAVYKKEGGLDGQFFAHQEEIDFCWRIRSRGYRIVCTPESTVYHVGGATLDTFNPRKTRLNFRNNLLMLYKNLPEKDLKRVMRARFWLDRLAAIQSILTGYPKNACAIMKGRKEFKQMKPQYKEVRERNLKLTTTIIPEIRQQSLLIDYYVKGRKFYYQL